jgi:hypothetical protein
MVVGEIFHFALNCGLSVSHLETITACLSGKSSGLTFIGLAPISAVCGGSLGHTARALQTPIASHRVTTFSIPRSAYILGVVLNNTTKSK